MDIVKIIAILGQRDFTFASTIISDTPDLKELREEVEALNLKVPEKDIISYRNKWTDLISGHPQRVQAAQVGYELRMKNSDPSLTTILANAHEFIESILQDENINENTTLDEDLRQKVGGRIAAVVRQVIRGYILIPAIKTLDEVLPDIQRQPMVFLHKAIPLNSLVIEVGWLKAIEETGLNPLKLLRDIEKEQSLVQFMISDFESRETPDITRTIKDNIRRIEDKIVDYPALKNISDKDIFTIGHQYAIRGENPNLWSIISKNRERIKNQEPYTEFEFLVTGNESVSSSTPKIIAKFIIEILQGYASSYFLAYLENQLKTLKNPEEMNSSSIRSSKSQTPNSQLKWTGQKNQIYDLFRSLKAEGFITAPYDELAIWLKASFDVFNDTKVSTIQKELGRDKKPPKGKRMDIKKMITPNPTP